MSGLFRLHRRGIEARFDPDMAAFLGRLPALLDDLGPPDVDPGAARLAVPVYLGDPAADAELRGLAGLDEERRADRRTFGVVLDTAAAGSTFTRDDAAAFLRVLVQARLVIAARAGVEVEDDYGLLDEATADVLDLLGYVEVSLLEVLSP